MSVDSQSESPEPAVVVKRRGSQEGDVAQDGGEATQEAPKQASRGAGVDLGALLSSDPSLLDETEHQTSAADDLAAEEDEAAAIAAELNQDFAALLAGQEGMSSHRPGDVVRGEVVGITSDAVFVDLGGKSEAQLDLREALDDDGNPIVKVGEEIEAQVVAVDGDVIRLSRGALKARQVSQMLDEAAANGIPVEGTVIGFNEGGLEVRVGGRRAFCPRSQIDRHFNDDMSVHVGRTYRFVISRYDPTGRKMVVSRRTLQEREQKELAAETRALLQPGMVMDGTVRKVMPFGAFVDLGGLDGLVHVSELSWERVEDPKEVVQEGQAVQVKVLRVDDSKGRVSLSMKQAQAGPWEQAGDLEVGQTLKGTVVRLTEFGAFVQVLPGIEGLVHVSELAWRRVNHPREVVQEGEEVDVTVLEVNPRKKRVALSMKQAQGDPWKDAVEAIKPGEELEVAVEKIEKFGIFCVISEGVTGLLPGSHADTPRGGDMRRSFRPGQKIKVRVLEIDRRRRKVTLTQKGDSSGGEAADLKAYRKQLKEAEQAAPSALALALLAAREKAGK